MPGVPDLEVLRVHEVQRGRGALPGHALGLEPRLELRAHLQQAREGGRAEWLVAIDGGMVSLHSVNKILFDTI